MLFVESKIGTFGRFRGYLHFKSVASAAASYCYLLLLLPLLLAEQRRLHSAGFSCAASCINIIVLLLLLLQYIRDLKGREREREKEGGESGVSLCIAWGRSKSKSVTRLLEAAPAVVCNRPSVFSSYTGVFTQMLSYSRRQRPPPPSPSPPTTATLMAFSFSLSLSLSLAQKVVIYQ